MSKIHVASASGSQAEYDEDQLRAMWEQCILQADAFYWKEGMD